MSYRFILAFIFLTTLSCGSPKNFSGIKSELYFGLSGPQGPISDSTWMEFRVNDIDRILDGYTIIKSKGYWTTANGNTTNEDSRILIYIHKRSDQINKKLDSIINLYKVKFDQESVLKTQQKIKAQF